MLKLSASHTRGALPYNTTPHHTAEAARILGRTGGWWRNRRSHWKPTRQRPARSGAKELSRYMALDNYRNNWLRIGFSEAELAGGGSDRFIDAMVLWGTADKVREGLRAHFAAGATQVCIEPVQEDGDTAARDKNPTQLADT